MTRTSVTLSIALLAALTLSGCSASSAEVDDAPEGGTAASTDESPSPTPVPDEVAPWASFTVADAAGYEIAVEIPEVSAVATSTIASAPPGYSDVTFALRADSATMSNLTVGRDLPSAPTIDLVAALEPSSELCTAEWSYWGPDGKEHSREFALRSTPEGCYLLIGGLSTTTLPSADGSPVDLAVQELPASYAEPFLRAPEESINALVDEIDGAPLFAALGAGSSYFGWQPVPPVCQTPYTGWLGQPFAVAASPDGVGCR